MPEALIHIVIATTDERKRAELQRLLADLPVAWLGVRELLGPDYQHPLGAGSSLEESARSRGDCSRAQPRERGGGARRLARRGRPRGGTKIAAKLRREPLLTARGAETY